METIKNNKFFIALAVIFLLIALLLQQKCSNDKDNAEASALVNALNDTIYHYTKEDGRKAAKISLLETQDIKDFLNIKSKDSTITRLQGLVDKYSSELKDRGIAGVIQIDTNAEITSPTLPINPAENDTVNGKVYPTYNSPFKLEHWVTGNVIAKKDSTYVTLKIENSFDVVIGKEKTGFLGLGKPKPFVDLTLDNPYSAVKQLRVYQTAKPDADNFHIGPIVGGGISSELKPIFFIGAGIMWTPISF